MKLTLITKKLGTILVLVIICTLSACSQQTKEDAASEQYNDIKLSVSNEDGSYYMTIDTTATSLYDLVDKKFIDKYENPYLHINYFDLDNNNNWICNQAVHFNKNGSLTNKKVLINSTQVGKGKRGANIKIVYWANDAWDELDPVGSVIFTIE